MGPAAATLCRALLGLSLLPAALPNGEAEDCSQPGIGCSITDSNCFDFSWLRTYSWTPNAPSSVAVRVRTGVRNGRRVPMLQINWTINMDSSIKELQGADLSVLEQQTNHQRCIQFQFTNQFPSQHNPKGQPWQFHYNNFEVRPGHQYFVTVQHLPKQVGVNNKSEEVLVPGCDDAQMMQTDTCCDLGLCWFPNIRISHSGRNLTVEFSPRHGANRYGIEVKVSLLNIIAFHYINVQPSAQEERLAHTFPDLGGMEDCLYRISVWPIMASCGSDCTRQYYTPDCDPELPPPPEPPMSWYLWFIAVLIIIAVSVGLAICCKDCISRSEMKIPRIPSVILPPTKKKVWLVYSADHCCYIDTVIRLADFLQGAWGLDVVLDRHHLQEIGMIGAMAWLGHQKSEIERTNGTILILCSRGVQEKWKAMQKGQQQRVTLRADREHPIGDLFTPALTIILPDFVRALAYDQYVVAYFDHIASLDDIPSLLEMCPKYALTDRLQDLFFRIQRLEQHQPNVQLTVCQEGQPSYCRLVEAMEKCRSWQEKHVYWFEEECSLYQPEESPAPQIEEEDVDDNCTRRVYPVILNPETDVSLVQPILMNPEPTIVLDPVIRDGPPCSWLEPSVRQPDTLVTIAEPLLDISPNICVQEPCLAEENDPLGQLLPQQDFYTGSEQDIQSREDLIEAQRRLFYCNVPQNPGLSYGVGSMNVPGHALTSPNPYFFSKSCEMEEYPQEWLPQVQLVTPERDRFIYLPDEHPPQVTDQGYDSMISAQPDLETIQREALKFFLQDGDMVGISPI